MITQEEQSLCDFESEIKEEMDRERHEEWKNTLDPISRKQFDYVFGEN